MAIMGDCHGKPIDQLVGELQTHLQQGLTQKEAQERIRTHGFNELTERPRPGFFALLMAQFKNFLVIILIVAALVTIFLGEYIDAIAITFIVVLNAMVG